jgi:hypothetical protein
MLAARVRQWLAAILLLVAAGTAAATDAVEDASLRQAERRGLDLYRADRAAWLTTDLLVAQKVVERVPGQPRGWTTRRDADVWHVAFVSEVSGQLVAFADGSVDFAADAPVASLHENAEPRPIDTAEQLQLRVRADAAGREFLVCSNSYNTVVLPSEDGGWLAYLLPAQQREGEYPTGGFHRFSYDADGGFVDQYAHTRTCLKQTSDGLPPGAKLAGLWGTHLTSPLPNEFHVFMSLAYGMPVMSGMRDRRMWDIENGRIAPLEQ